MRALTKISPQSSTSPVTADPRMAIGLAQMANAIEPTGSGLTISSTRAPTPAQRVALTRRQEDVDGWLTPAGADVARVEVAALLGVMSVRAGDDNDKRAMLEIYVSDLWAVPLFALRSACKAYRSGELGDGRWAPTPALIRQAADRLTRNLHEERAKLTRVLSAQVVEDNRTPERRAALAKMVEAVKGQLSSARPPNEIARGFAQKGAAETPSTPDERLEHLAREYGTKPIRMTPEALKKYGAQPAERRWEEEDDAALDDLRAVI